MKNLLFFFPINPLEKNEGNKIRALQLLEYFKYRGFNVDFVSQWEFGSVWSPEDITKFKESGLANNLYILTRKPQKDNLISYFLSYKLPDLLFKTKVHIPSGSIPSHPTFFQVSQFNRILKSNRYDYIIISYAYWANMIFDNKFLNGANIIIDTHDLLSSQHQSDRHFKVTVAIGEEIKRLKMFDQIWAISADEKYLFSQFLGEKVKFVPVMCARPVIQETKKKYDIIYVASQNLHNQASAKWFFEQVYPLIKNEVSILIVGRITNYLGDFSGVTKIPFVDTLDECYHNAKIAICPMLSGTGIKVKVVEALSYGLPVVCNTRGVDGLPNKSNNGCLVADDPRKFAKYIKQLSKDPFLYNQHHKNALDLFNSYFSREKVYADLDVLFGIKPNDNILHRSDR